MQKLVFGEGPIPAKIAFVGEAPGRDEERKGRPFIGQSGKLLESLMSKAGIFRQLCYITNVIKERPPNNQVSKFITFSRKGVKTTEEYDYYVESLKTELEKVNPNVIVAVGAVSLYALTGLQGITKYRGSILESTLLPGYKVIPVLHPAAALRQYIWRHFIAYDLGKVKAEAERPEIVYRHREMVLMPSFKQASELLDELQEKELFAFDIEIANGEVSHVSFSHHPESGFVVPFYTSEETYSPEEELYLWTKIGLLLEDENIQKVGHNVVFDSTFLLEKYGIKSKNLHDTMIAGAVLYPEFRKSLAFLTSIYTDIPYYKDEGKEKFKHGVVTDATSSKHVQAYLNVVTGYVQQERLFEAYSALDSIALMDIFPQQLQELERLGNLETYEYQRLLIEPILFMTQRGIHVHVKPMRKRSENIKNEIEKLQSDLDDLAGRSLNPNSPKQLKEYFYKEKKLPPYKHKGKPTTNEKALKRIAGKGYKEASLILKIRGLRKLKSTYLDVKLDSRQRLRYSINPVGTRFGRFSSGQDIFGRGTNVQNLPPAMRRYLGPDPGFVAYEIDLSQAENRIVAYLGNETRMIEAFETGADIHSRTAGYLFNMEEAEVKQLHEEWDAKGKPQGDQRLCAPMANYKFDFRYWGKRSNHALNYDMSPQMAALQWEVETKEARPIVEKYHRIYPGVRQYHEIVKSEMRQNHTLTNLFGRKYRFMDRLDFKEGYSYVAQSTVADKINRHGLLPVYFHGGSGEVFEPAELLAQIHDSVIIQIPVDAGWKKHSKILLTLIQTLSQPLESWHGQEFCIPCGVKMLPKNLAKGHEFDHLPPAIEITAGILERTYEELTQ